MSGDGPKRSDLLRRRVCLITQYAEELRRLSQLSREERVRRFGSGVKPILVPLDPRETESQHERRFQIWVSRHSSQSNNLKDNPAEERRLRMIFANIKVRDYDRDASGGKRWRRDDDDDEDADDDDDDDDQENQHVNRDYQEVNRTDDDDGDSKRYAKKRRTVVLGDEETTARPRRAPPSASGILLRKRVLPIAKYRAEVERESKHKLTPQEKLDLYGTTVVPVPVPLHPGESVEMYEKRFREFLRQKSLDMSDFTDDPNGERSQRMNFARNRVLKSRQPVDTERPAPPPKSTVSILDRVGELPREKVEEQVLEFLAPSSSGSTASVGDAEPVEMPNGSTLATAPVTHPVHQPKHESKRCTRVPPPSTVATAPTLTTFLDCGCTNCMVSCSKELVSKVAALEESAVVATTERGKRVMDLTHEADGSSSSSSRGVDVAKMVQITALLKSRRSVERQLLSSAEWSDDPIEHQLQDEYDEINDRIVLNQRVLDSSTARLKDTSYDQVTEATISQNENLELRILIEEEIDHRNAALAILIVYMWRHARQNLEQRATSAQASDVAHVQRICHQKCTTLSTEFTKKRTEASELKHQLEKLLTEAPPIGDMDAEAKHWASLERVGGQLTRVEAAVRDLYSTRRREYVTLLHFDSHLRQLVCTLMADT